MLIDAYNDHAERTAIAGALGSAAAAADLAATLSEEHFGSGLHRHLYRRIRTAVERGETPGPLTVTDDPKEREQVRAMEVHRTMPHDARRAVLLVHEAFMRRRAFEALTAARGVVEAGRGQVFDALASALDTLVSVTDVAAFADTHVSAGVAEALDRVDAWERGETPDIVPTGYLSLDHAIGGFPVGEITLFAGMTGAGKTSFLAGACLAAAERAARTAKSGTAPAAVVVFSAEMSREQLLHRMAATVTGTSVRALQRGAAERVAYDRHRDALASLTRLPLYVDDTAAPSLLHVQARCQQIALRSGGHLALIAFDYDEKADVNESKSEELRVSRIVQGFKSIAKRMKAPLLLLSQYSRSARHDAPPSDAWLRMSGKKEQEAAVILHWHYPAYWVDKGFPEGEVSGYQAHDPTAGHLVCTKNRFGPARDTLLRFHAETTRFVDPLHP